MSEPKKLLIVEDDAGLQRQLRWAYEGYEILTAGDRDSALAQLRAEEPQVVTLDLGLPPDPAGVSAQVGDRVASVCERERQTAL